MDDYLIVIAEAIKKARDGVQFDVKGGADCPFCGARLKIHVTRPWMGLRRQRYHRCDNPDCALCVIDQSIVSWQYYNGGKKNIGKEYDET